MGLLDDIKSKADANGDGKVLLDDLGALKDSIGTEQFEKLKELADQSGDGKISFDDIKALDFGKMVEGAKDALGNLGGIFGKK